MAQPSAGPDPHAAEARATPPPRTVWVSAVQAAAGVVSDNEAFANKIFDLVRRAVDHDPRPEILVFPEDVGLWIELGYRRRSRPKSLHARLLGTLAGHFRADMLAATTTARPGPYPRYFPLDRIAGAKPRSGQPPTGETPAAERGFWKAFRKPIGRVFDWLVVRFVRLAWLGLWLGRSGILKLYLNTFKQAAKECHVIIVGGSILDRRGLRLYNSCYVFDSDGSVAGRYDKRNLMGVETALGISRGHEVRPVQTGKYRIGALICYDFNFRDVASALAARGAQILCGGSYGWRPTHDFHYDPDDCDDAPQRWRSQETGLAAVRAYQAGEIFPDLLYCDGLSDIVVPAETGDKGRVLIQSFSDKRGQECILTGEVPLRRGTVEVEILSSGAASAAQSEVPRLLLRFPLEPPFIVGDPKEQAVLRALEQRLQPIAEARFTGTAPGATAVIRRFRTRGRAITVNGLGIRPGSPEVCIALAPSGRPVRRDQLRGFIDDVVECAEPVADALRRARS